MKKIVLLCLTVFTVSLSYAQNKKDSVSKEEMAQIEVRINELEEKQKSIQDWYANFYLLGKGRMSPFLGEKLLFGGFFETTVLHIEGPDTRSRTAAFDHSLGINLDAQLADQLRLVAQYVANLTIPLGNPHNNPAIVPAERTFLFLDYGSYLREGYVEIKRSEALAIRTGIGPVPFGYALQINNPFLFFNRGGPQLTANHDTYSIAPALWMGVQLLGKFTLSGQQLLGYHVYTFTPPSSPNTLGAGSRLWWKYSEVLEIGASVQNGKQQNKSFFTHGVDLRYTQNGYGVTAEYATVRNDSATPDTESYYLEPYVKFNEGQWLYYLRGDYLSFLSRRTGTVADPTKKWLYATGVNWLPYNNVRFRFGVSRHDYVDATDMVSGRKRDYNHYEFSLVTLF